MRGLIMWILLCGALLAGTPALANLGPDALVKQTAETILERLKKERDVIKQDNNRVYTLVDEVVLPHFDFERMSKWVLGKHWRQANASQQEQFIYEFRMLLVRTYAKALVDNIDQEVDYLPLRAKPDATDVTVSTEVPQEGGFPIPINYSMYLSNGEWKVYDVNIDGISLVANYRTSFANEIRDHGIDGLLKRLSDRNSQAANE